MARRVSLPLAGHLWIASQCVICAVQIVLRRRRAPLAWQEAAAVAYRLNSCGWGQLSVLMKLWLDHAAVATGPLALLWHALLLFFSSSAATLLLIPANALRLRWAASGPGLYGLCTASASPWLASGACVCCMPIT